MPIYHLSTVRKILCFFAAINILLVIYISLNIQSNGPESNRDLIPSDSLIVNGNDNKTWLVEIWSKSAIGQYLWENIFGARTESKVFSNTNFYIEGWKTFGPVQFHFRSGPSLRPQNLQSFSVENLVLILNWRSMEKIKYAQRWLDVVMEEKESRKSKNHLKNIGIIALGNEHCNNTWFIRKYLNDSSNKKSLRFLFIIYDWLLVDNHMIFQWPLGVATYRNFPSSTSVNLQTPRLYLCNFIATVYVNSTRQELRRLFKDEHGAIETNLRKKCLIKTRSKWSPDEDERSMATYVEALRSSDLTLSPSGMNHECYRILEAVEYGSIPVIEENVQLLARNDHHCDTNKVLRLFKEFQAPFIYLSNWTQELPGLLRQFDHMSLEEKIHKRIHLIKWYHKFKIRLRNKLVNVIQQQFIL